MSGSPRFLETRKKVGAGPTTGTPDDPRATPTQTSTSLYRTVVKGNNSYHTLSVERDLLPRRFRVVCRYGALYKRQYAELWTGNHTSKQTAEGRGGRTPEVLPSRRTPRDE